jgi:hypothetical protein
MSLDRKSVRRMAGFTSDRAALALGLTGILGTIALGLTCFLAWITHVVVCIKASAWVLLVVGAFIAPIGVIHGIMVWLGVA